MTNRKLYKDQMRSEFPNVPEYIIDWSLDILEADGGTDFFKGLMKRKQGRRKDTVKKMEEPSVKNYEIKCLEIIKNKEDDPQYEPPTLKDLEVNANGEIVEKQFEEISLEDIKL